jgi:DNA-binding NarL/FixJ family response regulator
MPGPEGHPIRVFLTTSDTALRRQLRRDCNAAGLTVVGEACCARAARPREHATPQVAVIALGPSERGAAPARDILRVFPRAKVLVLADPDEDARVEAALLEGASGHLAMEAGGRKLARAIRAVCAGQVVLSPAMTAHFFDRCRAAGRR